MMRTRAPAAYIPGDEQHMCLKILIADDQKHARSGLKALLRASMAQPEIWEAANGREAQELAVERRPDLVLMDIRMPEVDGLAATRWIKAHLPQVKIIVLSLQGSLSAEALAAGADGFVSKGESPEALLARVAELGFATTPRIAD
jgi:DNA-binding NarL/FixJ family response regulator